MPIDNIYCGIENLPKGKTRGSMKECIEKNQVRYWGLKKIDSKLIASMSTSKNIPSTRRKLIEKAVIIDAKIKNLIKKLKFSKNINESDKEKIGNDIKKLKEQRKKIKDELKKKESENDKDKSKKKSKNQKGGFKLNLSEKINTIFKLEKFFSKKLSDKKESCINNSYKNLFNDLSKIKENKDEYFSKSLKNNLSNEKFINKTIKIYLKNIEKID